MIISSQHPSAALAERKRKTLEKRYFIVRLLSRRNAAGRFSKRGQHYEWEVFDKPKGKRAEFVVHFDYGSGRTKNLIRFQVHVLGPQEATDEEAISAIRAFERGERKRGWTWKEIYWSHPPKSVQGPIDDEGEEADRLRGVRRAAIGAPDEVSVTRKNSVRRNRRTNRKAKQK